MLNASSARRFAAAIFAIVLVAFTVVPIWHGLRGHSVKDYFVWLEAGKAVLHGADVYPHPLVQKFPFMYPLPCALFLAPLAALGQLGLIVVLSLVCAAAWIGCVILSVQLATGDWRRASLAVFVIPNLIVIVYVWSNFLLGQPSLLLLALMLAAFLLLQRDRQLLGGCTIAFGAAIKAFPVIAIVYLLYRRYWVAAATLAVAAGFLLFLFPLPFRGVAHTRTDLNRWFSGMLFKYDENGVGQRAGRSNSWRNQSIWGVANRLLRHVDADPAYGPHTPVYANVASLEFATANRVILVAALLCGLGYLAVMPRRQLRSPESDALEFALLLLLMLMFTPMTFGYLFAWLLYPFTVAVQRIEQGGGRRLLALTIIAVALLAMTIPLRVVAQTYGNVFFAATLLFIALAIELAQMKRQSATRSAAAR